ncbi:IclR family transcriptional regulator [Psychrobacter sp. I-STPA10]|uniref:IclR family transcriptional regulator n=1 Tax=Psychrobacter sp. I-STPA10 TaxID=2585769 RepID=UPI001E5C6398|nr:IclR family transcriptional regulator [Psychrobacter sp. I-STPA10]
MKTSNTTVPAIDKMCLILDLITASSYPLTSAQIATELGLPRSSTHTILQSLLAKHLVYKDINNRFHLGSYLLYWGGKYEQQHSIIQVFHELISQHSVLLKHTVTLSKIDGSEVIFLACHEAVAPLGFTFHAGVRVPAAFSATGKAMLATYDDQTLAQLFANGMPETMTCHSVTSLDALKDELQQIRKTGISLDNGQLREGMYCLGTCIHNAQGEPIAGMAVSFLKREYEYYREEVSTALLQLAKQIANKLG